MTPVTKKQIDKLVKIALENYFDVEKRRPAILTLYALAGSHNLYASRAIIKNKVFYF